MACCFNDEAREQKRINKEFEKIFCYHEREASEAREVKLLLFGTKGCGKSTFIEQLMIIYGYKYTDGEKKGFTKFVYQKIVMAMHTIIRAMETLNICFSNANSENSAQMICDLSHEEITTFEEHQVEALRLLWEDLGFRQCYDRRREYSLSDACSYFLCAFDRVIKPEYVPSLQDVLQVQHSTLGIAEHLLQFHSLIHRMIDVSHMRSERRKWLHFFENVPVVMFMAALSDYDQVHVESDNQNRLEESKELFRTVITCPWFQASRVILFLNKKDIFEEKIMHTHLADFFPDYNGPQRDAQMAREYILRMFVDANPDPDKRIYSHFICATDNESVRVAYAAAMDTGYINLRERQLL